jgi:cystathionine beta-lyase
MQPDRGVEGQRTSARWRTFSKGVLPLSVAEMDFPTAPVVLEALAGAVGRSDLGYARPAPGLGEAFAGFAARRWAWDVRAPWVSAVTDVGVGVVELLRVFCRPGDAVVVNPPVYPSFFAWPPEAGARLIEVPLTGASDDYRLDLVALERAFVKRPAVYLLCNPHNPTGRTHTHEELEAIAELASRYGVVVISDEIHGLLALPGSTFTPFLTIPAAHAVGVSVLSASKAFNIAGLKCAEIVVASDRFAEALDRLPTETAWRVGHLGVIASVAAFTRGEAWLDELLATLHARRTYLGALLAERLPGIVWRPPQASFLAWLDCSPLLGERDARELFLRRGRVGLDPGLDYGLEGSGYVRLNFATSDETLDRATAAMADVLRDAATKH